MVHRADPAGQPKAHSEAGRRTWCSMTAATRPRSCTTATRPLGGDPRHLGRDDDRGQPALARASLCNQSVRPMVIEINPICGPASGDGGLSGDDDERCRRTGPPGLILARVALSH
jgi:hypothetical protein